MQTSHFMIKLKMTANFTFHEQSEGAYKFFVYKQIKCEGKIYIS